MKQALLAALFISLVSFACIRQLPYGQPGTTDFIQYWSAARIAAQGQNFYDPVLLHDQEAIVGQKSSETLLMWNPPWTLTLLSPALVFDFPTSAALWFALNCGFLAFSVLLSIETFALQKIDRWKFLLLQFAFVPALSCLSFGQMSLLLLASLSAFLYFFKFGQLWRAGLCLAVLSLKPHLVFLLYLWALFLVLQKKDWRLLAGFSAGMVLLIGCTALLSPHSIAEWIASQHRGNVSIGAVPAFDWIVPTVVGTMRLVSLELFGVVPLWPMWGIPLAALVFYSDYLQTLSSHEKLLPILGAITFSLPSSPYGWLFDQALLLPVIAWIFQMSRGPHPYASEVRAGLVFFYFTLACVTLVFHPPQHSYVWFPLAVALLFFWVERSAPLLNSEKGLLSEKRTNRSEEIN